ncbi:hypothetical protein IEO21_09416 [Rhodonia placenta]|uniref:Uncharacterized protein n=1 Tax=Rhodonia placenta TaxID=104341 RepID=A0A8H7TYF9_9APHY|nr:hypothetical protein IEO21_09416 [Postia placenta]
MSSTLSFLDQFNAPSTKGGKQISIYTPKHTHVGDSTLLTFLLSNPTDVFNKLKANNPKATNATDRAALEVYLSPCREYDKAVKAADEAIDHHKRLLRQQDDRSPIAFNRSYCATSGCSTTNSSRAPSPMRTYPYPHPYRRPPSGDPLFHPLSSEPPREAPPSQLTGSPILAGLRREAADDADRLDTGMRKGGPWTPGARGIINEAKERKEKERRTKAVPIPPLHCTNPKPLTSPIAGSSCPRPNTPVIFCKVNPDWTPDTTPWTWDNPWPRQEHLSGEEWKNVGRNARNEWFDEEQDNGIDWELFGDGEQ